MVIAIEILILLVAIVIMLNVGPAERHIEPPPKRGFPWR